MKNFTITIRFLKEVYSHLNSEVRQTIGVSLVLMITLFYTPLSAQINVTVPECSTCPGSGSPSSVGPAVASHIGIFPYKIEQVVGNSQSTRALRTENGVVFAWGWNGYGYTGTPQLIGYGTAPSTARVPSPTRIDLPAGVKAIDISVGGGNIMAVGDDGKLYGAGSMQSYFGGTLAYAGTTVGNTAFTEIPLPAGATSVVNVETSPAWHTSTVIIDNLGRAWFVGQDPNTVPNPNPSGWSANNTSTWSQLQATNTSVTFSNLWSVGIAHHSYDSYNTYFLEGSDGKYYTFGSNVYNAFGSTAYSSETTTEQYEWMGGFTNISHDDPLVEVAIPAGKTIVKFDGETGVTLALSDDGMLYAWGASGAQWNGAGAWLKFADGNPISKLPREVALPSGGVYNVSPTKFTAMTSVLFQCDDGILYGSTNNNNVGAWGNDLAVTANGYEIIMGPQFGYTEIFTRNGDSNPVDMLTTEGILVGYNIPYFTREYGPLGPRHGASNTNYTNSMPYFLSDPRWDVNNTRPTE